ncbi:MAG: DUF4037 domain-containing protein [Erysipelotrichaceae bacterium]|nr:DUF4037 domain-containing protein [Erysipelotrichaceae bacterium]
MKGIDLSRGYYEEYGKPMLEENFPDLLPYIAVGFVGSGSERFGFDDEISQDHDYEPGFCIFIPGEDVIDRKQAFQLERAYAKLPKEYMGFRRQQVAPVGGDRNGVIRTAEFFKKAVGAEDGNLTIQQWLEIPDYALAEAVNGEVFYDGYGEFSQIRERLMEFPEDIMLKRLAGALLIMAQSGQYNFNRCLKHGEVEAAQFACNEFVNATLKAEFLLQGRYMPYYKWSFRALKQLLFTEELAKRLSFILMADHTDEKVAEQKYTMIEEIASFIIEELQDRDITKAICGDLEKHAYSVNDFIKDSEIRNLNILITEH